MGWASPDQHCKGGRRRVLSIKNSRIERKLQHVFDFYRHLPAAKIYDEGGLATPLFVGAPGKIGFAIGSKIRGKKKKIVWVRSYSAPVIIRPPRVPDQEELQTLYNYLRGRGFREQKRLKLSVPPFDLQFISDRDWLMARVMAAAGLRCQEVADLTIQQLSTGLCDDGLLNNSVSLENLSYVEKLALKRRLMSLKAAQDLAFVLIPIEGKGSGTGQTGGKERLAPFPPGLICELLDHIWGHRATLLASGRSYEKCANVFISTETKVALKPGSIGDIIGKAYGACKLKGSAHKLRGHFATITAAALWREYFALNQYRFDQALVNKILDQLASYLGHSFVNVTIKHYLDKSLFKYLTRVGSEETKLFHTLWDIIVMKKRNLTEKQSSLIATLSQMITESDDDSLLMSALHMISTDRRFSTDVRKDCKTISLAYDSGKVV